MNLDFENLNMTNLKEVLGEIFFKNNEENKKYIVPLQGNWYNPTQKDGAGTWIGYVINSMHIDESVKQEGNLYYRASQTEINLTFVGNQAEELVQSVLWWIARADVANILDKKYKGVLNNKPLLIYSTLYEQGGLNNTICWSINISLRHNMLLNANSPILQYADLSGNLIIGG